MAVNLTLQLKLLNDAIHAASRFILRDFSEISQLQSSKHGVHDFAKKCYQRIQTRFTKELSTTSAKIPVILVGDPIPQDVEYFYILEPICGIHNFEHNIPFCCNAAGLFKQNPSSEHPEALVIIIHNPILRESFYASKNGGAWFENYNDSIIPKARLRVSTQNNLADAFITSTVAEANQHFSHNRCLGSHLLELAYFAAGRFDLIFSPIENLLTQASFLLIKEAGGHIEISHDYFIGSNENLHKKAIPLFNQLFPRPL